MRHFHEFTHRLSRSAGRLRSVLGRRSRRHGDTLARIDRHLLRDIGVSPTAAAVGRMHAVAERPARRHD